MSLRESGGRTYWTTKPAYIAECQDCDWQSMERNAQGIAAQHHDRTGHTVRVEITRVVYYQTREAYEAER